MRRRYECRKRPLTEHDFVSGDDGVELEGFRYDSPLRVSVVKIILMDESTTVRTAHTQRDRQTDTHTTQHTRAHTHTHTNAVGESV